MIMNIYNTFYFIEYTRNPIFTSMNTSLLKPFGKHIHKYKSWYLNLSKNKYNYRHRTFDLIAFLNMSCCTYKTTTVMFQPYHYIKKWYRQGYEIRHRLIGPYLVIKTCSEYKKYYYNK